MRVPTRIGYALGVAAAVALFAGCSGTGSSLNSIAQTPGGAGTQSVVRNHVPTIIAGKFLNGFHPSAPSQQKSWVSPDITGALVYICGFYASACDFAKHGSHREAGFISGLSYPQGVGVDRLNNVYVANTGASDVPVFAKGALTPTKTLDDSGQYPVDVALDRNGTVYVANIFDTSFNPGS